MNVIMFKLVATIVILFLVGVGGFVYYQKSRPQSAPINQGTNKLESSVLNNKEVIRKSIFGYFNYKDVAKSDVCKMPKNFTQLTEINCNFKISSQLPVFSFKLLPVTKNYQEKFIEKIKIYQDESLIQILGITPTSEPLLNIFPDFFEAQDANFDGYLDIKLLDYRGATGNEDYLYWLYNPLANQFIYNSDLSNLTSPIFSLKTKEVISLYDGGQADLNHIYSRYKFDENGNLVLIWEEHQEEQDPLAEYFIKTVKELQDGELKIISTEIIKGEDLVKNKETLKLIRTETVMCNNERYLFDTIFTKNKGYFNDIYRNTRLSENFIIRLKSSRGGNLGAFFALTAAKKNCDKIYLSVVIEETDIPMNGIFEWRIGEESVRELATSHKFASNYVTFPKNEWISPDGEKIIIAYQINSQADNPQCNYRNLLLINLREDIFKILLSLPETEVFDNGYSDLAPYCKGLNFGWLNGSTIYYDVYDSVTNHSFLEQRTLVIN